MGFSLPPAELAMRDSALLRKLIKCIFSIPPVGNLEKSRECFSLTGRWPLASDVLTGVAECTGRTGVSPVLSVRCAGGLATLSAHESGEHQTLRVRPVAPLQETC